MVIKDILKTVVPVAGHVAEDTYYLYKKAEGSSQIHKHPLPEPVFEILNTIKRIPYINNNPVEGSYDGIVLLIGASGLVYRLIPYGQWSKCDRHNAEIDKVWFAATVTSIDNYAPTYSDEFDNVEYICLNFMKAIVRLGLKDKFRDIFDRLVAMSNELTTTNTNS